MTYGKESTDKFKRLIVETQKALERMRATMSYPAEFEKACKDYDKKHSLFIQERDRLGKKIREGA